MLNVVATVALLCWMQETGSEMARGLTVIAVFVMFVLSVLINRGRRRQGD